MKYLMFEKGGFIKKFPLNSNAYLIGRGPECDLILDDQHVSKHHCRIRVFANHILVEDLNSRNGSFVEGKKITSARITLNKSFNLGGETTLFYKQGDTGEFTVSQELSAIFGTLSLKKKSAPGITNDTSNSENKFDLYLGCLLKKALENKDFKEFINEISRLLAGVFSSGSLHLIQDEQLITLFNKANHSQNEIMNCKKQCRDLSFQSKTTNPDLTSPLWVTAEKAGGALLFIPQKAKSKKVLTGLPVFFEKLLEIIAFNKKLIPALSFDPTPPPVLYQEKETTIVGNSEAMRQVISLAKRIAPKSSSVLILGESGTGKEMLARMIHHLSDRKEYVAINCSAIPATLLESELFGHEAGAFTDARKRKIGKLEQASGGTLLLDELAEMPLDIQAKLLRVLQERSFTRLGGSEEIAVDPRIIAITNCDLYKLVEEGRFRGDLFYRLRVHELRVPALRERPEDIIPLITHFSRIYAEKNQVSPQGFSFGAQKSLLDYSWPGNIRELENEIRRIMEIIDDGELIGGHHLVTVNKALIHELKTTDMFDKNEPEFKEEIEGFERRKLVDLLQKHGGNRSKTAKAMGISYQGLVKKMKRLQIR